ncbi:hypothetical protein [Stackebrandtia soli]|uniref:hypothetical protein n=1 Tax=Stackebrandtia soli TaxID=1892856 RepID=UPI0039E9C3F0
MITVEEFRRRTGGGSMPVLTLTDFFDGNTVEDSIAPNQWEYGRPPIHVLAKRFRDVEARADVAWVRVQPHGDSLDLDVLCGEAVAVCASADEATRDGWMNGLEASGVIDGLVDDYAEVPTVPEGCSIWSIVWD